MPRISFRLSTLFTATALIALVSAILVTGSQWCSLLLDGVVGVTLIASTITAVVGAPQVRVFARGFSIAAGVYFVLAFIPSLQVTTGPQKLVEQIARKVHALAIPIQVAYVEPGHPVFQTGDQYQIGPNRTWWNGWGDAWERTHRAIDSVATILIGCPGGALAVRIQRRQAANETP